MDLSDFLFASNNSPLILGFLSPLDLLKLLHVSKSARKAAVPHLLAYEAEPLTKHHAALFHSWLTTSPIRAEGSRVLYEEMSSDQHAKARKLAGPLRFEAIESAAASSVLRNRFVVLRYQKVGYQRERCEVAAFSERGAFVAYYELQSKQFYESFVDKWVHDMHEGGRGFNADGGSNHSTAEIRVRNCSGGGHGGWTLRDQGLNWEWQEGFFGDVTTSNYELFNSFRGLLSPTEVSFVLMHALSEDTRVIYQYVEAVFDSFGIEFDMIEDDPDEFAGDVGYGTMMMEWRERLAAASYDIQRPELRFEIGAVVLCKVWGDRWQPGEVVKHWYRTRTGDLVPYQVRLDSWFGRRYSVPVDADSEIKRHRRPHPRFEIGTEVLCKMHGRTWISGRIEKHWDRKHDGTLAPYRVDLNGSTRFEGHCHASTDTDAFIKLKNPDPPPAAGTANNSDQNSEANSDDNPRTASGARKKKKKKKRKKEELECDEEGKKKKKEKKKKKKKKKQKHGDEPVASSSTNDEQQS